MKTIIDGMVKIVSEPDMWDTVVLSLKISFLSTAIAFFFACFFSLTIVGNYEKRKNLVTIFQLFLFIPSVTLGLILYLLFSRKGFLGFLGLLYTSKAVIIGESILIFPLISIFLINGLKERAIEVRDVVLTLGANSFQYAGIIIRESKISLLSSFIVGLSRAIGETGLAMVVGGNIQGETRVMTTAIVLYTMRGDFEAAIGLGIILFVFAIILSCIFLILAKKWKY